MAYHILLTRSIFCEKCLEHLELLSGNDKSAKGEAEGEGWKLTRKGWRCAECKKGNGSLLSTPRGDRQL